MKMILTAIAATLALMGMADASHHSHRTSSHQFNVEDAMKNKDIVLMAIGAAVYYQDNCAGLTNIGITYLNKAIIYHKLDTNIMTNESQYQLGFKLAEDYPTCSKLRFAITDVGLGAMIR